jgi:rod shape-determining protein MreD
MKNWVIVLVLAVALLMQTVIIRAVADGTAPVDLVLVVVVFTALFRGPVVGLWTGTVSGILQDVLSGGIVGVSGLTKSIIGLLVGILGAELVVSTIWHRFAVLLAASVVHAFFFLGVYSLLGTLIPTSVISLVLVQAVSNASSGMIAVALAWIVPVAVRRVRHRRTLLVRRNWIMG